MSERYPSDPYATERAPVVGFVIRVDDHPYADRLWVAQVDVGVHRTLCIVFGGERRLRVGELVPVAKPYTAVSLSGVVLGAEWCRKGSF